MIEEQSSESFSDEIDTVDTIENNANTSTDIDLDKYNLYVDKIRALFVPSLERRIHSCLEKFVYRKDVGQLSEFPYLKRCLDVAAAWREPVDAFCTKWTDEKFLKNMLSHAVKYLIKNDLIDCFLNSIILNNRLNKVCRDLDTLGVERDFLRYLTVWNYMNERDYWIDNDEKIAMSMSRQSYDSIDRHSDLDVEIGSRIDNYEKVSRRALKRRAKDDSSQDLPNKNDDFSQNFHSNDCTKPQCESWLSIDSSIKEESRSSDGTRRKRSMCQKFSCRATTCPFYRMKNFQNVDWEGKMLKLQLCKFSSTTSKGEALKSMETSKLRLPCKFDDLIGKIVKSEATGSSSISRRRKFQAKIINICCRVNEILEKIVKNEIRRCRLDCEIFRDLLSFRLMKKEANGCKVCLLSERVMMNKMEVKSRNASRGSSTSQLTQIAENENSQESNLTIYESARFHLDESPINQSSEKNAKKITRDLSDGNIFDISEDNLKETNLNNLKETTRGDMNGNVVENEVCRCAIYFDSGLVNVDEKNQNNQQLDNLKYFQSNSKNFEKLSEKESENHSTGDILEDETCNCNKSFHVHSDNVTKNNQGIDPVKKLSQEELLSPLSGDNPEDQICHCNISLDNEPDNFVNDTKKDQEKSRDKLLDPDRKNREQISRKKTFTNLIGNAFNDQESLSNESVGPEQSENRKENSPKELTREESSTRSYRDILEDQKCLCNSSIDNPLDNIHHESKDNEDSVECVDKRVEDVPQSNHEYSKNLISISNSHEFGKKQNEETSDSPFDYKSSNHRKVLEPKKDLITCKSVIVAPNEDKQENEDCEIACACPLDCTCINKENSNDQEADCDSQCSCDSYDDLESKKSQNCPINDPHIPSDFSDKIPKNKSQGLIISRDKIESNCIEAEEINRENNKSKISQEFDDRKVKSRSLNETPMRDFTFVDRDRELVAASSVQCSEMKESKVKSYLEGSSIVSARFKKSKGQRINISIELCPESESSREKMSKSESKNILTLQDECKKNQSSRRIKVASSRQSRCIYIDGRGNSEIQLNSQPQKNTKDECLDDRNAAMHLPRRPLEFRDYLASMEEPSSMRNPNVYGGTPMKSVVLSNDKFDRRSMNQEKRNVKNYETKECWKSIRNRASFDKTIQEKIRSDEEQIREEFPRILGKSERFSNSIIDGHHCHGFSSSSVKRMKHLIKTKLRRILLERDKSTNTSKMTLTNRKYRVSVPNGKTERPSFGRQSCRTIWESRSVSDSTCTSLSLISEDGTFSPDICDREKITNLFFSTPSTRRKISSSNCRNYSRISGDFDFTKNCICTKSDGRNVTNGVKNLPRLAGGCDFSPKKVVKGEEFRCLKKQRHEFLNKFAKKENGKCCEKSINCSFHEITENTVDSSANDSGLLKNDDCDSQKLRKKYENELITCSGKLDSEINSTSRHIHLYEFGQCETSNDELFHCWEQKEPDEKFNPPKTRTGELGIKNFKMNEKLYKKNVCDSRTKKPPFIQKENKIPRNIDELKNSSSNLHTMNYRQRGFSYLDYDLRSKLSQYVSLCKNVKHSLLKRLRPGEIYGVDETSISFGDRYKFGDS